LRCFQSGRVSELPTAPAQSRAGKYATFFVVDARQRHPAGEAPGSGIWGVVCPPQLEDGQVFVADYVRRSAWSERTCPSGRVHPHLHHFKLHITPVLLRVEHKPHECSNRVVCGWMWKKRYRRRYDTSAEGIGKLLKNIRSQCRRNNQRALRVCVCHPAQCASLMTP